MRVGGTRLGAYSTGRGLGNQLWDLAGSVPSLDLRFAENKSLVDATTGSNLITFTRAAGPATYFNSSGVLVNATTDEPRFDHNPTTGESLGLLVEEQRTNLLLRSEEFDNASWAKSNVTITPNSLTAPNGIVSADTVTDSNDGAAAAHAAITPTQSFTSGLAYTISVYAQAGTLNGIAFIFPSAAFTSNLNARFNISTGTIQNLDAGLTGSIAAIGGGWYRCSATATATATASNTIQIRTATASSSFYQGTGTGTIYIWGAQLEVGAFPTSYIPTTTAAATRSADVAQITGTNFSSWYNTTLGSIYSDSTIAKSQIQTQFVWNLAGGTFNTSLRQPQATANQFRAVVGNTFSTVPGTGGNLTDGTTKAAVAVDGLNGRLQVGTSGVDIVSGGSLDANRLDLGSTGSSSYLNGTIRRLTYWPQRLSNTTLQQITS